MLLENLLLTTLFLVTNFTPNTWPNNSFERKSIVNYAKYLETQNIIKYNENFVDNLYDYNFIDADTTLTVLTHGMGGNRDYWFPKNEGYPSYFDIESLPYKIINSQIFNEYNIPIISFTPVLSNIHTGNGDDLVDVRIEQLVRQSNGGYNFVNLNFNSFTDATELFSQHVVLIYNDEGSNIENLAFTNTKIADYFCKSLDTVLARVAVLHQGSLPKINLIGHSRGGLLNLYYAYKRQQIVDNYICIGTPLNGSLWAKALNSLCKLGRCFSNAYFYQLDFDGLLNDLDNVETMLSSITGTYKETIGCQMSPSVFCGELLYELRLAETQDLNTITFGNDNFVNRIISKILGVLLTNPQFVQGTVENLATQVVNLSNIMLAGLTGSEILYNFVTNLNPNWGNEELEEVYWLCRNFLLDIVELFNNIKNFDTDNGCIKGDFCVDFDSQYGSNFGTNYFNHRVKIPFGNTGYNNLFDKYLSASDLPKVVHNYESNFPAITDEVVGRLIIRGSINRIYIIDYNEPITINPYRVPFYNLTNNELQNFYSSTISFYGNEFGFRDYYYYESEILNNESLLYKTIEIDDFEVLTSRMRTGYIQSERIVLSSNRTNAGLAFLEFYFSEPIYAFTFDISLWSENELINESELRFAYSFNTEMRDFISGNSDVYYNYYHYSQYSTMTARGKVALMSHDDIFENTFELVRMSAIDFSSNRFNSIKMAVSSINGFTFVGFYSVCNPTVSNKNRGRICMSNFGIFK